MSKHNSKHHYVPKFLLRQFKHWSKDQVVVFDKRDGRQYISSINDAGCESGFNSCGLESLKDFPEIDIDELPPPPQGYEHLDYFRDVKMSIEEKTAEFDSISAELINGIVRNGSFQHLTNEDKYNLAIFVAVQMERGPVARGAIKDLNQAVFDKARQIAGRHDVIVNGRDKEMSEDELKFMSMMVLSRALDMVPILLSKIWILFSAPDNQYLVIGDSPVTKHNAEDFGPYGNLGLLCRGVEINIPISKKYSIGIYCRSFWDKLVKKRDELKEYYGKNPLAAVILPQVGMKTMEMIRAIKDNTAYPLDKDGVMHLNFLQIAQSRRYIYSSIKDSSFLEKVLEEHPEFRKRYGVRFD